MISVTPHLADYFFFPKNFTALGQEIKSFCPDYFLLLALV